MGGGALFISGIEVQCVSVSEHVWVGGSGLRGGVGWGYQPGVYVPLKALFLVLKLNVLFNIVLKTKKLTNKSCIFPLWELIYGH